MNFLASKNVSLACSALNGIFAVSALLNGSLFMFLICGFFCAYCFNNYKNA